MTVEGNVDSVVFHTDLEPTVAFSGVVSHSRIHFLHVNSTWTLVGRINGARRNDVRFVMELECHGRAGIGGTDAFNTDAARNTWAYSLATEPSVPLASTSNEAVKGTHHRPYHRW